MSIRTLSIFLILLLIAGAGCGRKGDNKENAAEDTAEAKSEENDEAGKKDGKKGEEEDEEPMAILEELFPDREVVGVGGEVLAGGGAQSHSSETNMLSSTTTFTLEMMPSVLRS